MVNLDSITYNENSNLLTWNYDLSINFIDIYKLDSTGTITHSTTEIKPTQTGGSGYSVNLSEIRLMGEEGQSNENPLLLNIEESNPVYYMGISGPNTPFVTTNSFEITDNQSAIMDFNEIPTFTTPSIYFKYNVNKPEITSLELYKVGYPANKRRFIDASANVFEGLDGNLSLHTIDLDDKILYKGNISQGLVLDTQNGGTYYLGLQATGKPFAISGFFNIGTPPDTSPKFTSQPSYTGTTVSWVFSNLITSFTISNGTKTTNDLTQTLTNQTTLDLATITFPGETTPLSQQSGNYTITANGVASNSFVITYTPSGTFTWTNTFAVGGVAVTGGEANDNCTFYLNANYDAFKNTAWDTTSNLVRVPIVWAIKSKGNNDAVLFTDVTTTFPFSLATNWAYDSVYLTTIVNVVTDIVNKNKVAIIDYHTYTKWNDTNRDTQIIAKIWEQTLRLFDNYPIFKNPLVWFELVNEPYAITNLADYQPVINAIRSHTTPYTNKIIMGLDATSPVGHVVSNSHPNNFYNGFNSYTGGFSTDSANNLCLTLHQYFNQNGSGADYAGNWDSTNIMCNPSWLVNGDKLTDNTTLNTVLTDISTKCQGHCDIILGEFGYDEAFSESVGKTAAQKLLDTMNTVNTTIYPNRKNSSNILTQTQGGVWLGFATWVHNSSYDDLENQVNDAMITGTSSTYSKYFS